MSSLRAFLHRTLPQVWQRRGWAARLLWPLSQLYALAWRRRQRRAMQANTPHLPVSVLVVGNVIAGGAGKTPTTIAVVQAIFLVILADALFALFFTTIGI